VKNEVERIEVLADLCSEAFHDDAMLFELVNDRFLAVRFAPSALEIVQRRELRLDLLSGEVPIGLGDQLSVGADILDALRQDANRNAAHVNLARAVGPFEVVALLGHVRGTVAFRFGRDRGVVVIGFIDYDGLAIKLRIIEQRRRLFEIRDGEIELVV
jgi:hypothetical protein